MDLEEAEKIKPHKISKVGLLLKKKTLMTALKVYLTLIKEGRQQVDAVHIAASSFGLSNREFYSYLLQTNTITG